MATVGRKMKEGVRRHPCGKIRQDNSREIAERVAIAARHRDGETAGLPVKGTAAIYIMRAVDRIKVGVSIHPARRSETLTSETGLLHTVEWAARGEEDAVRRLERAAHKLLKTSQYHIEGEWYRATVSSLAAFILRLAGMRGVYLDRERLEDRKQEPHLRSADTRVGSFALLLNRR